MAILKQSTAYNRMFLLVQSSDHITGLTGATPTVKISKSSGTPGVPQAFGSPGGGSATEIGNGWYYQPLSVNDTNGLGELAWHITATSGDPTDFVDQVQSQIFPDLSLDGNGNVSVTSFIKKATLQSGLTFLMKNSTSGQAQTGLTVTAQRSIDGNPFASCTNAVTEVGNGVYAISLSTTDTNGGHIMLLFTAPTASPTYLEIITDP